MKTVNKCWGKNSFTPRNRKEASIKAAILAAKTRHVKIERHTQVKDNGLNDPYGGPKETLELDIPVVSKRAAEYILKSPNVIQSGDKLRRFMDGGYTEETIAFVE